ncbi:diacylglycerol/lipid kinase family protein [Jeotgalibacillus marinus]|uniref:Diacylglycerol kinase family protein n=1 Tax=Jeotgalibacillus marinus TaxID=86667 RepID=A0ABV3Q0V5_9BACL
MKIILIINPKAKSGQALRYFRSVQKVCDTEGIDYWITKAPGDASSRIQHWCLQNPSDKALFVGVGGDGTMHEVLNGVAGFTNALVACIPAGSGNDFARSFQSFPRSHESIVELSKWNGEMIEQHDSAFYEGIESGWFVNNLGIGFDALVAYSVNKSPLKKWFNRMKIGKLIYVFYLIRHLFTYAPITMEIRVDGKEKSVDNVWFVTVSNQPYYGGGMKIAPNADSRDGELDLTIVHNVSRWKFLAVFISVFKGNHLRFKEVTTRRGKLIHVHSEQTAKIHADGEEAGQLSKENSIQIEVHPQNWTFVRAHKYGS